MAISERFPALCTNLGDMDDCFKVAMKSTVEEFGERVSEHEWNKATAQDIALLSKNLMTPRCFAYAMFISVERLMFMINEMFKNKEFEQEFYSLSNKEN